MIELDESMLLSTGSRRATYRHPLRSERCIKIEIGKAYTRRSRVSPWLRVPAPGSNQREIEGFETIRKKLGRLPGFMSSVYGLLQTNKGEGLEVECVVPVGAPSFSLRSLLKKGYASLPEDADLGSLIDQFEIASDTIVKNNIYNHCSAPESFIYVKQEGSYVLKIIDYKTIVSYEFIPLSSSSFFQKRFIKRRMSKIRSKLDKIFSDRRAAVSRC